MSAELSSGHDVSSLELMTLLRRLNVELDRFVERFAVGHGLHRTDLNAVVVILDAAREGRPLTPGGLGAALNLSAPATTALLNRLEQAGHVERHRSATDRRKVELALHDQAITLGRRFFAPLTHHLSTALDRFTGEEREVIRRFLTDGIDATITAGEQSRSGETGGDTTAADRPLSPGRCEVADTGVQ